LWKYFFQNKISYLNPTASSHTPPWFWFNDYQQQEILILVRGVDPYTEKQEIKYDLSELFGQPLGTTTVTGEYFLNIPIQQNSGNPTYYYDQQTPESHSLATSNSNTFLFHQPIGFTVDTWRLLHSQPIHHDITYQQINQQYLIFTVRMMRGILCQTG